MRAAMLILLAATSTHPRRGVHSRHRDFGWPRVDVQYNPVLRREAPGFPGLRLFRNAIIAARRWPDNWDSARMRQRRANPAPTSGRLAGSTHSRNHRTKSGWLPIRGAPRIGKALGTRRETSHYRNAPSAIRAALRGPTLGPALPPSRPSPSTRAEQPERQIRRQCHHRLTLQPPVWQIRRLLGLSLSGLLNHPHLCRAPPPM